MIHELDLVDRLSGLTQERFEGTVFRVTRVGADPMAPSITGGRWAPRPRNDELGVCVLYTSFERDAALAEVASYLVEQTPVPKAGPLKVTKLVVSTAKTLRVSQITLEELGVDMARYGRRDYARTQEIGAALAFLQFDGLIAPSARWSCDNLMIFADNHGLNERLEVLDNEEVE